MVDMQAQTPTTLSSIGKVFLTVPETAEICRCTPITIRRAIAAKRLTVVKNSRYSRTLIRPSDLEAYIRRATQYAVGETP
jgi:hypothetical protein